jgi:hypothetical protein
MPNCLPISQEMRASFQRLLIGPCGVRTKQACSIDPLWPDSFLFLSMVMRQNQRHLRVRQYECQWEYQITWNKCNIVGRTIGTSTFWGKWLMAYLCFRTSKRYELWMKSIYSDFLMHRNFASHRRFDRLSNGLSRSHGSTKPGLCRSFCSSKSSSYGFCLMS